MKRLAPVIDGAQFLWRFHERHGCADLSDLTITDERACLEPMGDIYVCSQRTGVVMLFELTRVVRDRENDISSWEFRSDSGVTITIYND